MQGTIRLPAIITTNTETLQERLQGFNQKRDRRNCMSNLPRPLRLGARIPITFSLPTTAASSSPRLLSLHRDTELSKIKNRYYIIVYIVFSIKQPGQGVGHTGDPETRLFRKSRGFSIECTPLSETNGSESWRGSTPGKRATTPPPPYLSSAPELWYTINLAYTPPFIFPPAKILPWADR